MGRCRTRPRPSRRPGRSSLRDGPRTVAAAEFLIERWRNPGAVRTATENATAETGPDAAAVVARLRTSEDQTWTALIAHIGPDWSVVQEYVDDRSEWWRRISESARDGAQGESAGDRPSPIRAVAAARAILDAGGEHAQTVAAAEFLSSEDWSTGPGDERHLVAGARALLEHAPDFDGWLDVLRALDRGRYGGDSEPIATLLEEVAAGAQDPVARAGARYYVASGLMRRINDPFQALPDDWAALRERALEAATGLSAGLEEEPFAANVGGTPHAARTFAEAEADLVAGIRHAAVGGTLPELTGRRLDGREEPLSAYRGRVLLIDFWATWCVPCIVALPELRALVADLPADQFALLAVSVDEERVVGDRPDGDGADALVQLARGHRQRHRAGPRRPRLPHLRARRPGGRHPVQRLRAASPAAMHGGARGGGRGSLRLHAGRLDARLPDRAGRGRSVGRVADRCFVPSFGGRHPRLPSSPPSSACTR